MKYLFMSTIVWIGLNSTVSAQSKSNEPREVNLSLPDQYEKTQELANHRGDVVVLLYGDRKGIAANKELGEQLHVQFHPTAKGQPPAKAAKAPVIPLDDLPEEKRSPDVKVIPVACIGKVPNVVKGVIRSQIKKEAPETPVWLDFEESMKETFGMKASEPNLVVIDAKGRLRFRATGVLDEKSYARLVEVVSYLRKEAVEK
jgi:hypothetical protein